MIHLLHELQKFGGNRMARGERSLDKRIELMNSKIAEEEEKMTTKIASMQAKIDSLVQERDELIAQKEAADLKLLKDALDKSGKTIEEIMAVVTSEK
nr:MAG TPA: protein of unknown function (DUF4315) [Caudoviricetes sp.]